MTSGNEPFRPVHLPWKIDPRYLVHTGILSSSPVNPKRSNHYALSDLQISQSPLSGHAVLFQRGLPRKENNFRLSLIFSHTSATILPKSFLIICLKMN
ncbi:hypothetical protein V513_10130 [Mesotoga sp. H07.pep.5.3]|nr:hypothetical protein V513_10130 [Mesotoga sp. H07.pep.5.3]